MVDYVDLTIKIIQGIFLVLTGTIAILTYLRARHTILQPMRAEIFKRQLDHLTEALRLFVGRDELRLREEFGLTKAFHANMHLMYDEFAAAFFDMEIDESDRPYGTEHCRMSLLSAEFIEKYVEIADDHIQQPPVGQDKQLDHRLRAARWSQYIHEIKLPNQYIEATETLRTLLESPLLPTKVATLIDDFLKTLFANLTLSGRVLSEAAQEMPERYDSIDNLHLGSFNWLVNRYNERIVPLKPQSDAIVSAIRTHWDVDNVLSLGAR